MNQLMARLQAGEWVTESPVPHMPLRAAFLPASSVKGCKSPTTMSLCALSSLLCWAQFPCSLVIGPANEKASVCAPVSGGRSGDSTSTKWVNALPRNVLPYNSFLGSNPYHRLLSKLSSRIVQEAQAARNHRELLDSTCRKLDGGWTNSRVKKAISCCVNCTRHCLRKYHSFLIANADNKSARL